MVLTWNWIVSTQHILIDLIFKTALWGRYYCFPRLTEQETEAPSNEGICHLLIGGRVEYKVHQ